MSFSSWRSVAVCLGAAFAAATAGAASPFDLAASVVERDSRRAVELKFAIPPGHHIYADTVQVEGRGATKLAPLSVAAPERKKDSFTGEERDQYAHGFVSLYAVAAAGDKVEFTVAFQGCNESECFFPETREFSLGRGTAPPATALPATVPVPAPTAVAGAAAWKDTLGGFRIARRESGYLREKDFLDFLAGLRGGGGGLLEHGWPVAILLILAFGAALNLTPCVLPMIPVNLAIIGAGAQAGSRRRGFLLGGVYGLGMALAYGALGLAVVLTGSTFGTLQSSPWFNLSMAVVFVLLALAMFGVFNLDFTRLQNRIGGGGPAATRSPVALSFVLGAVAALLAGACVAPVLVSVLVLGSSLYQKGNAVGLLLPFLLGVGMALPWPFAGAGLSFLPRPGGWMDKVKYGFGVLIVGMAGYYAWLGIGGLRSAPPAPGQDAAQVAGVSAAHRLDATGGAAGWAGVMDEARRSGKPVFVDFWATWCKNCHAMDATTFRSSEVTRKLGGFVVVKFQAEKPADPAVKSVLDHFGVLGLPTYVVLEPASVDHR